MKEPNEIDLLFQTGLDDLTFTPDPHVKENIDHAIASKKKRRRFLFILFPVLFGLTGFAAIGLFYQNQRKNENENKLHTQNEISRRSGATDRYEDSSEDLTWNDSHSQKKIESKNPIARNSSQTTNSSKLVNFNHLQKSIPVFSPNEKHPSYDKQNAEAGSEGYNQETRIKNIPIS